MKTATSLTAVCAVSLLGAAAAQQPEQQPEATQEEAREGIPITQHQEEALRDIGKDAIRQLDEDGDGTVSRQEAEAEPSVTERWDEYDRNSDQIIDAEELAAIEQHQAGSAEEQEQEVEIARGEVTEEGLPSTRHQQEVTGEQGQTSGQQPAGQAQPGAGQQQPAAGGLVERLDADGDGAISEAEAQGSTRLVEEWDQLDRNDDGKLDSSELGNLAE